jgi:hypothetical protein
VKGVTNRKAKPDSPALALLRALLADYDAARNSVDRLWSLERRIEQIRRTVEAVQ